MKFSIIIPVKDDPRLFSLLEQLASSPNKDDFEIVVSCNASSVGFVQKVEDALANCPHRLVLSRPEAGPSRAINYATNYIASEKFLILDSDCIIADTFIPAFLRDCDIAPIVRGHIVYRGSTTFSKLTADWRQAINALIEREGRIYTPNLMIDKNLFSDLGKFSEIMRFSYDSDFSDHAMGLGHKAIIVPDAILYHDCHENIKTEMKIWQSYGRGRFNRMKTHWHGFPTRQRIYKAILGDIPFAQLKKSLWHFLYGLSYIFVRFSGFVKGAFMPVSKLG